MKRKIVVVIEADETRCTGCEYARDYRSSLNQCQLFLDETNVAIPNGTRLPRCLDAERFVHRRLKVS